MVILGIVGVIQITVTQFLLYMAMIKLSHHLATMHITILINNSMKYIYLILTIIIIYILSGLFTKIDAQEIPPVPKERPFEWTPRWVGKHVPCGPIDQIIKIAETKGLKIVWSGKGVGNSPNLGIVDVDIFLSINPETQEWSILEIGIKTPEEGCLLGYGIGHHIDLPNLKLFQEEYKG